MSSKERRVSAKAHPGLGTKRFLRYRAAFARVRESEKSGYYLEGIAIVDSLLSDRLASRLGHLRGTYPEIQLTTGALCKELLGRAIEKDTAFRAEVERIKEWVKTRNDAIHATAKTLRSNEAKSFSDLLKAHRSVLASGIERLKAFNALDVMARRANGAKRPATEPGAFDDTGSGRERD